MDGRGWSEWDALGWDVVMVMVMVMIMVMVMVMVMLMLLVMVMVMDTVYGSLGNSRQV